MKKINRRTFLQRSGLYLAGSSALSMFGSDLVFANKGHDKKVLVVIFQRGAADALSIVPPTQDRYLNKKLRPTTRIETKNLLKLNEDFGMHPALKSIYPLWEQRRLAIIQQVGSPHPTRSHFDAQDYMESGVPGQKNISDGFLDRLVVELPDGHSHLRSLAIQPNLPRALWGESGSFAISSIQSFTRMGSGRMQSSGMQGGFEQMYAQALDQALRGAGENTFDAMDVLKNLPKNQVEYPKGKLATRLADIARIVKGDVGLRVAMTDIGGWDTHKRQGAEQGQLANRLKELGGAIDAFVKDLGPLMKDVCIVTMTEFGRTVKENGSGGTDHGHGSYMFVIGDAVAGKEIYGDWKSLSPSNLYEGRDLPISTDFRDVWTEVFASHMGVKDPGLFPGYAPTNPLKLFS